MNHPDTSVY